jgi:hypothetical protein
MRVKVKRTGVIWVVSEGSPTARRIEEQPDDYMIITALTGSEAVNETKEHKETKKKKEGDLVP